MELKREMAKKNMIKTSVSRKIFNIFNYVLLTVMVLASLLPLWYMICMSFSSNTAVDSGLVKLWPVQFTLDSYKAIMQNGKFFDSFLMSVVRVLIGVPVNMLMIVLIAYPLSRPANRFSGKKIYTWFFMFTMFFSGGMVPAFMVVKYTHLINSIWALILPSAVSVFNMLILLNFFRDLPQELEESAFLDGAGHFTILFKIFIPLAKPAIATLVLFAFVTHWNTWFDGLMYINDPGKFPLQTYLQGLMSAPDYSGMTVEQIQEWTKMTGRASNAAQIVITTIPIMIIYPFLQKYYTKGLTLGGVKG